VESDCSSLDFPLFYVDLVTAENDGNVFTYTLEVTVPVRNILVCDSRCDVEHDDTTLALDVVSVSQTTKFFLSSSIPNIETYGTEVGREGERVDFDTERGDVLLFKFTRQVALDESGFSSSSVTD